MVDAKAKAKASMTSDYLSLARRKRMLILAMFILLMVLMGFAMSVGAVEVAFTRLIKTLINQGDVYEKIVVWQIRLPRILTGVIAGSGLAVSGCMMQTSLKNPIASPATLGIANAAAFGANVAIVCFGAGQIKYTTSEAISISHPLIVTSAAFFFSVLAMIAILSLAKLRHFSPESVILSGVAFGSLFSAGSTLIQYFADDVQVAAMVFWTFGDLGRVSWANLAVIAVVNVIGLIYFLFNRWQFNALDTSDATAMSLGVDVEKIRFVSMIIATLMTAVLVAFMGVIGFVGLIAPQMMRRIIGADHRFLVPASALMGAILLLVADVIARMLLSPVILPVGAITSFFGAPLFLYLLLKGGQLK